MADDGTINTAAPPPPPPSPPPSSPAPAAPAPSGRSAPPSTGTPSATSNDRSNVLSNVNQIKPGELPPGHPQVSGKNAGQCPFCQQSGNFGKQAGQL